MFTLRFDLRAPAFGASHAELTPAAIDMCAWAEDHGGLLAVLSEHHDADDGHLTSPVVLAAAIAARTSRLHLMLASLVLPLYDPVRLAEELALVDLISGGRVSVVLGVGHRPEEYAHHGASFTDRGRTADAHLGLVRALLRGESVEHEGRILRVTPRPVTPGGPPMLIAGASRPAMRRAARHGLGVVAQADVPGLVDYYEQQCRKHGHSPGFVRVPQPGEATAVFVADDVDLAWAELGDHLLHDAVSAAAWRSGDTTVASISHATDVEALRASGPYSILTTADATEAMRAHQVLNLAPLCGGIPPSVAWPYLHRAGEAFARAHP